MGTSSKAHFFPFSSFSFLRYFFAVSVHDIPRGPVCWTYTRLSDTKPPPPLTHKKPKHSPARLSTKHYALQNILHPCDGGSCRRHTRQTPRWPFMRRQPSSPDTPLQRW